MKKIIIKGCDHRGDGEEPYLTRWYLLQSKHLAVYLHKFHRSDSPDLHDHPWSFISIVLWRGYIEETFRKQPKLIPEEMYSSSVTKTARYSPIAHSSDLQRKRIWPGTILFRSATHAHRVLLIDDKPAYTLLINFGYIRQWGFFTKKNWKHFINYFDIHKCNTIKT